MSVNAFVRAGILATLALSTTCSNANSQDDDEEILTKVGKYHVEERGVFRRLLHDGTLCGTQINRPYLVRADAANVFGVFSPWEALALEGSLAAWDPRLEPLTYYHRTGPVGAIFHELRTRKNGADAKAPIGVIGLSAGTTACYALAGQGITYYETNPELKKLVADTDRYFTFLADARKRGAMVEIKIGSARKNLSADAERKYAVLLVELYDDGFDPGDRLTVEAVKLYMDRVRADGIVAIHLSNKYYRTPPVAAAIAEELNLAARVWHDDTEFRPGKTSSSWAVFVKDERSFGILAKSVSEQALAYGTKNQELIRLLKKYGPGVSAKSAISMEWPGDELSVEELTKRHGDQAGKLIEELRRLGELKNRITLEEFAQVIFGAMFHPLGVEEGIGTFRDSDRHWPLAAMHAPNWLKKFFWVPAK